MEFLQLMSQSLFFVSLIFTLSIMISRYQLTNISIRDSVCFDIMFNCLYYVSIILYMIWLLLYDNKFTYNDIISVCVYSTIITIIFIFVLRDKLKKI